ncbi:MAG: hypothetical protein U0031_23450 [Thermomicrobiales bacterium]
MSLVFMPLIRRELDRNRVGRVVPGASDARSARQDLSPQQQQALMRKIHNARSRKGLIASEAIDADAVEPVGL